MDQPFPQAWKQKRLNELGYKTPSWLHFVSVDFESGESWWDRLVESGYDLQKPTVVFSTGVSMYLTKETNISTFLQLSKLAPGSIFATTFMLALDVGFKTADYFSGKDLFKLYFEHRKDSLNAGNAEAFLVART